MPPIFQLTCFYFVSRTEFVFFGICPSYSYYPVFIRHKEKTYGRIHADRKCQFRFYDRFTIKIYFQVVYKKCRWNNM